MPRKITTSVPKTFDDQLEAFVAFLKTNKISGVGIDAKQLDADIKLQRDSRQKDLEAQRQYEEIHRAHLEGQTERYARYMTAVSVVRAANRDNAAVLKSLAQFKRPSTPRTPAAKKDAAKKK